VSQAQENSQRKIESKRRGWARFLTFFLIGTFSLLLGGFIAFAQHVDHIRPPAIMPNADGIVVWTGKGGGRLQAGGALLKEKKGERLLISGVHKDNDSEHIANARETASWALALDYNHIILVTSAYHMPRAKVEISTAAGRMRITPYPVERADGKKWYKSLNRSKRLLQEYSKLLLSYAKGRSAKIEAPQLETPPQN